ncbi:transcriptional regulator [Lactococcus cremoris]|uniref:XRE family transcriptional regulator n=1 Tax=Lactococcus lactis subsp. cremoris TaxID=1359 RepID=UPI0020BDBF4F|nr:XRE family transcriptional regulator [Lactococcus cremoris]MCT0508017.1 XRE family transcriptional regulator [Lactococcus cremoris]BDE09796.1 transcriptional regulator [Lactococcus cremoris]
MTILDRIKELSKSRDKTVKEVAIELGLGENYLYSLKNKIPNGQTLQKLADYFHVSVDYLLGRDETEPKNQTVDLAELANKPKDFDWDSVLSVGGKPIPEEDKEIIRRLFAHKLSD